MAAAAAGRRAAIVKPDTALFVISCDRYSDVWPPFFTLLERYWPDNPFPVYLLSDTLRYGSPNVRPVTPGKRPTWGSLVRDGLSQVPHKNVLLILEDYLINGPVNTAAVLEANALLDAEQAVVVYLRPYPELERFSPEKPHFGRVGACHKLKVDVTTAIWNRERLMEYVRPEYTAWDMEIKGSVAARDDSRPFLGVRGPYEAEILPYLMTAVQRGKWTPRAVELLRREGISNVDISKRGVGWLRAWVQDQSWLRPARKAWVDFQRLRGRN